jgi:GTPase Era involved in 16S rRNA processing
MPTSPSCSGKGGEHLKRIASEARQDMEKLFDRKVFLNLLGQGEEAAGPTTPG